MKNGVKKSVISAIMICTVVVSSLGIGIASAKTVHPRGKDNGTGEWKDSWTYYSSYNVLKLKKSSHSEYVSFDDHTSTAQVGDGEKVKDSAAPRFSSNAIAYGDDGIAKAWYNNTSDIGSIFDF